MNPIETLHNAVATMLTTEATFIAALTAAIAGGGCGLPSVPQVIRGARPIELIQQVGPHELPAWVLEALPMQAGPLPGFADDEHGLTVSAYSQAHRVGVGVGLVWHQQDIEIAYTQRLRLPVEITRLFLRTPDAGAQDTAMCIVSETEPDGGLNHPWHVLRVALAADVVITRD